MNKSDKKMENTLREALTEVCEVALEEVAGFKWLTHFANYSDFPDSLSIVCVFDTSIDLSNALGAHKDDFILNIIREELGAVGIHIKHIRQHVSFDTEEACKNDNRGNWKERFISH